MLEVGFFRHNAARFDLRNHRNLAVNDGRIGYVGSLNIVDAPFVPGHPNEELVARVTGPVVAQIQAVLIADRFIETGSDVRFCAGLLPRVARLRVFPPRNCCRAARATSGRMPRSFSSRSTTRPAQRVVITTPYFVPDEPFLAALRSAAGRGVEVRLIVSRHANQDDFTQLRAASYYDELLGAGVHIHLYRPRFLHAKHLSVDDSIAVLGSTNIDIRSFALNAEVSFIVYDPAGRRRTCAPCRNATSRTATSWISPPGVKDRSLKE